MNTLTTITFWNHSKTWAEELGLQLTIDPEGEMHIAKVEDGETLPLYGSDSLVAIYGWLCGACWGSGLSGHPHEKRFKSSKVLNVRKPKYQARYRSTAGREFTLYADDPEGLSFVRDDWVLVSGPEPS